MLLAWVLPYYWDMQQKKVLIRALAIVAFASLASHAALIGNEGFECGTAQPTASGVGSGTASSLCDWYQWANSGPVVTTWQSMSNVVEGSASAHIQGGVNDGLYQYGFFAPSSYTASAWFYVNSGSAEIGLFDNGGTNGAFSGPTTTTGQWEYVSATNNLVSPAMGPVIYGAGAESDFFVDAFWLNAGETSTSPYDPSTGFNPNQRSETDLPAVPEPGTFGLMGLGLLALAYKLRRK